MHMSAAAVSAGVGAVGSLAGGVLSHFSNKKSAKKQYKRQKEFAQNQIQWKVQDAKRAGLHPLYALGSSANYSPAFQDTTSLGQGVSDAAGKIGQAYEQSQRPPPGTPVGQLGQQNIKESESRIRANDAETALKLSQSRRMIQTLNQTQDSEIFTGDGLPSNKMKPVTPSRIAGKNVKPSRQWSDAEEIENRYGDLASWLYGIGVIGADAVKGFKNWGQSRAKSAPLPRRPKRRTNTRRVGNRR